MKPRELPPQTTAQTTLFEALSGPHSRLIGFIGRASRAYRAIGFVGFIGFIEFTEFGIASWIVR